MFRLALVLSVCVIGLFGTPAKADDATECYISGRNQPWGSDSAIAACTRLIRKSSAEPRVLAKGLANRCVHYRFAGQAELAVDDCTKSLALEALAETYVRRGVAYAWLGKHELAIADLNAAIKLEPNSYSNYLARANIYFGAKRYDEAVRDYTQSMTLNGDNAWMTAASRAAAYTEMGKHDLAIKDYNVYLNYLLDLDNNSARKGSSLASTGYRARAYGYLRAGKPNEALIDVNQALARSKDDPLSWRLRGMVYEALGKKSEAISDYRKALSLDANDAESRNALGKLGAAP